MRLALLLASVLAVVGTGMAVASDHVQFAEVQPGRVLEFPADHGAHPAYRNEWWYITGWLKRPDGSLLGFQVTFFRFRPGVAEKNPSAFAAKQILFAHAALSDPKLGHLLHQERVYRQGFDLAAAATGDADVVIGDWTFRRTADGRFHSAVFGKEFTLDLTFTASQPVLPEGENGYSQKGPRRGDASYYYSIPHLAVSGRLSRGGSSETVSGTAWLDHEWSSNYLDPDAAGWDWTGLNLDDGDALMAFRIRDRTGGTIWTGGSLRDANGKVHVLAPGDVQFTPLRQWRSPQTAASYPVETILSVHLPDGVKQWHLTPLFDSQEYDSRKAGGPVYWEGAVRSSGGIGYLELTGYFHPLRM